MRERKKENFFLNELSHYGTKATPRWQGSSERIVHSKRYHYMSCLECSTRRSSRKSAGYQTSIYRKETPAS